LNGIYNLVLNMLWLAAKVGPTVNLGAKKNPIRTYSIGTILGSTNDTTK